MARNRSAIHWVAATVSRITSYNVCYTKLLRTYSQWQLREVLFDFWFNHFNIYGREFPGHGMLPEYDRVLRQHLFGNFGDLLNANAKTA